MKDIFLLAGFVAISFSPFAQKSKSKKTSQTISEVLVPMVAERWNFQPGKVEFLNYKGIPAMKISSGHDLAILKDFNFSNGTIEFDVEPQDATFTGIYFRMEQQGNRILYLRWPCRKLGWGIISRLDTVEGIKVDQ